MRLKCVAVGILGVILVGICTAAALRHTTWLEGAAMSGGISRMLEISEQETELQETVEMPFELIRSVSVIISNDGKDNNSRWELEDLREKQPEIVVWNPEHEIWGWTYYCNELSDYIYENYTRRSDTSLIWEIK